MSDICVIVAAFNAERTVSTAVRSALCQFGPEVEVIAVDDASTDNTFQCLSAIACEDSRLTVLQVSRNAGPAAARNLALSRTRARYVTVLDADDLMIEGRLARLLALADAGGWDIVADDLYKVASFREDAPKRRVFSQQPIGQQEITLEAFIRGNLSRLHGDRGEMGFLKPLIRREFLVRHHVAYDETLRLGEDYIFYAAALAAGARFLLTDPLGYYALTRADSLSGRHSASDLAALVAADQRFGHLAGLTRAERAMLREHEIETQKRWRWLWLIEAVQSRDLGEIARCFVAPPAVIATLLSNLAEQFVLRSRAAVSPTRKGPGA